MDSTISETLRHVLLLARHLDKCDLRGVTIVALMELGVPTKSIGFEYLKRAILLQHEDPTRALAKDIYLEISLRCKLNSEEQVDQAIRDATRIVWEQGSKTAWHWYFSYDGHAPCRKLTNGEFISKLSYILELWQACNEREICYGILYQQDTSYMLAHYVKKIFADPEMAKKLRVMSPE